MVRIACPPDCPAVFTRLTVSHAMQGGSVITWDLDDQFRDPGPYQFQLIVGRTGNPRADDWTLLGEPVTDTWYLVDNEKRLFGNINWTHYAVGLTTPVATYYSRPEPAMGRFNFSDWLMAREIRRMWLNDLRRSKANRGYLLKRRIYGTPCPACLDYMTDDSRNPDCSVCYGTGVEEGYYAPLPCVYAKLPNTFRASQLDETLSKVDNLVLQKVPMLADPQLHEYDIWVDWHSDNRFFVNNIQSMVDVRGRAVVSAPDLHLIPYGNVEYSIVIENMTDPIEPCVEVG